MTRWTSRTSSISVGDRVAYSANFLRSTGQFTGDIPFARGTVTELQVISPDVTLAIVDWGNPEIPAKVNVLNLCRVGERWMSV